MIEKCAVKVQVLEALSISDCPAAIIEVLPLLVVGAAQDEVRHTQLLAWVNHNDRCVGRHTLLFGWLNHDGRCVVIRVCL